MMKITTQQLWDLTLKPWELGYEMDKQLGLIESYRTTFIGEEKEDGTRDVDVCFVPNQTIEFKYFKVAIDLDGLRQEER